MGGFTLATDRDLRDLDERYRSLFVGQSERLVPVLEALEDDQWRAPSRNADWTVHQTFQHVAGVRIENVRVFEGGSPTWSADFDPHRSPQEDIDTRASESPAETVAGFVDATERFLDHLQGRSASDRRTPMLWGEEADFRLFFLHLHWDSWIHERDMLLPLDLPHAPDADSSAFATAYAVLFAGVAVRMSGGELETSLAVDGVGRVDLRTGVDVLRVDVDPDGTGDHRAAGAGPLVDALAGRGELAAVVDAPAATIDALSRVGTFLRR
jgi:uncharacterized protein (TIGR03083 family)